MKLSKFVPLILVGALISSPAMAAQYQSSRAFIQFSKAKDFFVSTYARQKAVGSPPTVGMSFTSTKAGSVNITTWDALNVVQFQGLTTTSFTASFPSMSDHPGLRQIQDNCMTLATGLATAGADTSATSAINPTRGLRIEITAQPGQTFLVDTQATAIYADPAKIATIACTY